jgi:prepilin-type N-terminal cleavage/methylation domain-containing protein
MKRTAFTLVEILIVVVILGILAAVVIPAMAGCVGSAKDSALAQDLSILKRYIVVYKAQHNEVYPGYPNGDKTQTPTEQAFLDQTLLASDQGGATAVKGTAGYSLGPYMEKIPSNPFVNDSVQQSIQVLGDGEDFPAVPDNQHGWIYKPATGEMRAGDSINDQTGKRHYDY